MKVLDMLNYKWYEKEDLIQESYKVFLEDGTRTKKQALKTAKQYVKENSLNEIEVAKWVKEHD